MKKLGVLVLLAASSSVAFSQTAASFKTSEYYRSRSLDSVKAAEAWAKGYTGKGVTIAILDSGILTSNPEFINKIKLTKDFTGQNNIVDTLGHGTHVAGLAAAARNGSGMVGVAPDANLMIGKITTNGITTGNIILQAINWASVNNAKVINLSFNTNLSSALIQPVEISSGVYKTRFSNTGSIPVLNAYTYATAMNGDSVLVIASGNDGTAWSGAYSQLAVATDNKGELIMGGRVIVAGNWNSQTNASVGPGNNGAAHLCQVVVANSCQDKYQMWQFYLLAPGTGITSVGNTSTGLRTLSGTSMAAPTISGAAAIVRQMWPQLNAAKTVQILLLSANKNIPGYNRFVHGQGLLDLDKATQPLGIVGLPTTSSITGAKTTNLSPVIITGGSASTAGATSLMVLDEFDRDFYLPGKNLTATYTQNESDVAQTALSYLTGNIYSQFNEYNDYISVKQGNVTTTWFYNNSGKYNRSPAMGEISYNTKLSYGDIKITSGMMLERGAWLGNFVNGFDGVKNNKDSVTHYIGVNYSKEIAGTTLSLALQNGITKTESESNNIKNIDTVKSYSWSVDINKQLGNDSSVGIMFYQPVSVYEAKADLIAPVGLDENFGVIQNSKADLAADVRELRTGIYYKVNNLRDINLLTFAEYRKDYRGQEGKNDLAVGIVLTKKF